MSDAPNIVFIVFDTMRKDALGTYGGAAATPSFDSLAKDGTAYGNCVAPSPWTTPSHVSFFTGLYPSEHGVHETRDQKAPQLFGALNRSSLETLATSLRAKGYNTVGYSANPSVSPGSGFDLGFNSFTLVDATKPTPAEAAAIREAAKYGRDRSEVTSYLVRHGKFLELIRLYSLGRRMRRGEIERGFPLEKGGRRIAETLGDSSLEQPFFLFLNLFEMHEPYTHGEPTAISTMFARRGISTSLAAAIQARYRREAEVSDSVLGAVLSYLRANGAYEDALVVATSDHGQCLSEHGYFGHGTYLYDEIAEVPLIVKPPSSGRILPGDGYQSLVDLAGMLRSAGDGARLDGDPLTRRAVLSESFGIAQDLDFLKGKDDSETLALRDSYEVPRKAVYSDGYKLVVNGAEGKIEEFTFKGKAVDPRDQRARVETMAGEIRKLAPSQFALPTA